MFDPDDFLDAARTEEDDRLRVLARAASESRDWHVIAGNHMLAEFFNAVMCACCAVRDERARLNRLDFDPGVTSFPDPDV